MTDIVHQPDENRLTMSFPEGEVWVDYARQGDTLALLHVEAEPQLRGTGASGRFMQATVDFARAEGLKLRPVCGYAVVWLKRHADAHDVLA